MPGRARALAALAAATLACLPMPPAAGAPETGIRVRDFNFFPSYKVVFVGTTVKWSYGEDGESVHTVTAYADSPERFDSSPDQPEDDNDCLPPLPTEPPRDCIEPGESFSWTFDKPGTYEYYCKLHDNPEERPDPNAPAEEQPCIMCGIVRVKTESTPTTPPSNRDPDRTDDPTETATPTRTATGTRSASPTASGPSPTSVPDGVAAGGRGGGGGGKAAVAVVAIVFLGAAAYLTWRRYLSPS